MKVQIEVDEVNHNVLNQALKAFSSVLNNHLVADGNKINLQLFDRLEEGDGYTGDSRKGQRFKWVVKASIEWERKLIKSKS